MKFDIKQILEIINMLMGLIKSLIASKKDPTEEFEN